LVQSIALWSYYLSRWCENFVTEKIGSLGKKVTFSIQTLKKFGIPEQCSVWEFGILNKSSTAHASVAGLDIFRVGSATLLKRTKKFCPSKT
jgi:hypothetical protein